MLPFISDIKVVLVGLYKEQDCPFKMLTAPNNVVNHVMPIVWGHLTWHWQVIFFRVVLLQIIITFDCFRCMRKSKLRVKMGLLLLSQLPQMTQNREGGSVCVVILLYGT